MKYLKVFPSSDSITFSVLNRSVSSYHHASFFPFVMYIIYCYDDNNQEMEISLFLFVGGFPSLRNIDVRTIFHCRKAIVRYNS